MTEAFIKAMNKILEDQKLSEEFANAKTPEEKYEVAKPYLDGISFEEFEKEITFDTLSIDELDEVAGGMSADKSVKAATIIGMIPGIIDGLGIPADAKAGIQVACESIADSTINAAMNASDGQISGLMFAVNVAEAVAKGLEQGLPDKYKPYVVTVKNAIRAALIFMK